MVHHSSFIMVACGVTEPVLVLGGRTETGAFLGTKIQSWINGGTVCSELNTILMSLYNSADSSQTMIAKRL
jgi:hypothetical protein